MKITDISIKRPSLVIVVFTALTLLGLLSYFSLGYELLPKFSNNVVSISTIYPGASPNEVENTVTKKIDSIAQKISIPLLMLQSGNDIIVKLPRQNSFCKKAPNCKLTKYESARHEILHETDSIRNHAMTEIKNFIKD